MFDADISIDHIRAALVRRSRTATAALLNVSDRCIEPMAPKPTPDNKFPVGRFLLRNDSRFHSAAGESDDVEDLARAPTCSTTTSYIDCPAAGAGGRGAGRRLLTVAPIE